MLAIGDARQRRNQGAEGAGVAPHREGFAGKLYLVHRLLDFLLDALGRQAGQLGRALDDRGVGVALDVETETRGKANRAQSPQTILSHPLARVADGTYEPALQILLTLVRISHFVPARRVGDGVDRVITAGEIVVERGAEF